MFFCFDKINCPQPAGNKLLRCNLRHIAVDVPKPSVKPLVLTFCGLVRFAVACCTWNIPYKRNWCPELKLRGTNVCFFGLSLFLQQTHFLPAFSNDYAILACNILFYLIFVEQNLYHIVDCETFHSGNPFP